MLDWRAVLATALGGAIGSVLRYAIQVAVAARIGTAFPWATFGINVAGSFLIGVVAELAMREGGAVSPLLRVFLAVGVLGGFTTFSSLSFETLLLARSGAMPAAVAYAAGSVATGVVAAYLGAAAARGPATP